ncbi:MAG: hypothetical protein JXL80_08435 [Planctomycetes bacterium]|nr:hypothetical protein [Planctomycetota bacterium]
MKPTVVNVKLGHLVVVGVCSAIGFLVVWASDPLQGWPSRTECLMIGAGFVSPAVALFLALLFTRFTWKTVTVIVLTCLGPTLFFALRVSRERDYPEEGLGSVQVGEQTMQFYTDFGSDSAVLGFSIEDESGRSRYCPFVWSSCRNVWPVTLDVFVSDSDEMWVIDSGSGLALAYYRIGSGRYMTRYGSLTPFDMPMPDGLGGGMWEFPDMNTERVRKALTITYPP